MENKKSFFHFILIVVLLIFAYSALNFVKSYSKSISPSSFRSFSVSGEGRVSAIPDISQFTFSVITQGDKTESVKALQERNTEKANEVLKFVKSEGIEKEDIKTQVYNLEPRYQTYPCPQYLALTHSCKPSEIIGYTVTQTILVKIKDFEKIGRIFSGVVEKGANAVSQLSFTIEDQTELQNQARVKAIEKAKDKAKAIAKAGDFKLGRLLYIEEAGPVFGYRALEVAAPAPGPSIEPGSQEITVNVTLRYEIK